MIAYGVKLWVTVIRINLCAVVLYKSRELSGLLRISYISGFFFEVGSTEKWTACSLSHTLLKIDWVSQITSYTTGPTGKKKGKKGGPTVYL